MKQHIIEFKVENYGNFYNSYVECKTKQSAKKKAKSLAKKHKVHSVIYKEVDVLEQIEFNADFNPGPENCKGIWTIKERVC